MARSPSVQPNKGMEPIAYSLRFAAASGNGSCLAFGACGREETHHHTPLLAPSS